MRRSRSIGVGLLLMCLAVQQSATAVVTIDTVTVGSPGNAADVTGFGAVPYEYRIGKYEVTIGQWAEFLNATARSDPFGIYNPSLATQMTSAGIIRSGSVGEYAYTVLDNPSGQSSANRPITYASFVNAARFANWMHNGQGAGDTETGAYRISTGTVVSATLTSGVLTYTMAGPTTVSTGDQVKFSGLGSTLNVGGIVTGVISPTQFTVANTSPDFSVEASGPMVAVSATHSPTAAYWIPTEDEWYKAAYYSADLNGGAGGYYLFATGTDTAPGNTVGSDPNQANYSISGQYAVGPTPLDQTQNYLSDVGAFAGSVGIFGTFDMNGNVNEWNSGITDSLFGSSFGGSGINRGTRGGAYSNGANRLQPTYRDANSPVAAFSTLGFRLAAAAATPSADIVIDVAEGKVTQAQAGYPVIATANSVTKTGAGTLVFDAANTYSGPTTVSAGTLEAANASALGSTNVTVNTGATLAIAPGITPKTPAVIVAGGTLSAATLAVNSATGIASLAINSGTIGGSPTVAIAGGGTLSLPQTARLVVGLGGLTVDQAAGGGRLDLGAGQVNVAAGGISAADLRADIIAGRNGGAWNGTAGIISSTAAASGGARGVGYVVAGDGSARVSFAAPGDIDLSGSVNVFDLVSINSSGKYGTGASSVWSQGDFNYDGVTNVFDLVNVNTGGAYGSGNYFPAAPTISGSGSLATVPEPAGWAVIIAAGCLAAFRRLDWLPA